MAPGFVTLYLYTHHVPPRPVITALSAFLAVAVPVDILRLNFPFFERLFERLVGLFMRESEKVRRYSVSWATLSLTLFHRNHQMA